MSSPRMRFGWLVYLWSGVLPLAAAPPELPLVRPEAVGMVAERLAAIDEIVQDGLQREQMPGCVVLVGRRGKIALLKAYGDRQRKPEQVAMTTDTVFDMASITKPVATATSVMRLVEEGLLALNDPIAKHIPEFAANGKEAITVEQLLVHQGGLIPDNSLKDYQEGPEVSMQKIYALKPYVTPGTRFVYTDVGFIVLAELVKRISGKNVHEYSQEMLFQPLGMSETTYLPSPELRQRAAPTEQRDGEWMRGEVHDPRAYLLGGIAGHAGLFSTAKDLARFAEMLRRGGEYSGVRVLQPETIALMTSPVQVSSGQRGRGWDIRTGYSSNRGDLFSSRAFGHGGFTGTTFWVDPDLELFVIFLSNRLHPDGKGLVNPLAGRIGTVAAAAILDSPTEAPRTVLTGIDILERDAFQPLQGRKVGLITNHTGINRAGESTASLLHAAEGVELVALFSPEHGFAGQLDVAKINDTRDPVTGLPVHSLYGATRVPTAESLQGIDTLVFDIQDVGTRFYTYISTMGGAMRAAAEHGIRFVVLDRPNPIGGLAVQGPMLDPGSESFVGYHRLPVRHGLTTGELARLFNQELELGLYLQIITMEGWRRADFFDATGLMWVNPSPNMRSLTQALLYPGIGLLETTNVSVGRGTDTPFEVVGAPWLDGVKLAGELNAAGLPGVRFVPVRFTPTASKFEGEVCGGINVLVTHRSVFHPLRTGLLLARELRRLFPDHWKPDSYNRLLSHTQTLDAVLAGNELDEIEGIYEAELNAFLDRRTPFLMYE